MGLTSTVITGLGVVAPSGVGVDAHWSSTIAGDLRVAPVTTFDTSAYATKLAGQVPGFRAEDHIDERLLVQCDRWTWMSLAAAAFALDDAGYDPAATDPYATAVILASGTGGNEFGQREIERLWSQGRRAVSAYQSIAWFYAASTGQVSIRHQLKGPSGVVVSEAAGGLDSIGQARRTVRRGTKAVLTGGTEAALTPYALACQITGGRLTTSADPVNGYKPFDRDANGQVPGEGGAVLLVEDAAAAAARPTPQVYGEVAGYAATHDAHHHERPSPDPRYLVLAMRRALDDAGIAPAEVDVVFADGAGIPALDATEAQAIQEVFGDRGPAVTAPQGLIGRLCAGGAALNVVNALLAMRDGLVPAVGNLDRPAEGYQLDLVTGGPRRTPVRVAMVNARGYGGFNSSLILCKPEEMLT